MIFTQKKLRELVVHECVIQELSKDFSSVKGK